MNELKNALKKAKIDVEKAHSDFLEANSDLLNASKNTPYFSRLYEEIICYYYKYLKVMCNAYEKPIFKALRGFPEKVLHKARAYDNYKRRWSVLEGNQSLEATGWKIHTYNCILIFDNVDKKIIEQVKALGELE